MGVVTREVTVVNELGMHARPSGQFVKLAATFASEIEVHRDQMRVNGKSILGLMTLAAECGARLTLHADGEDADTAVEALANLVDRGFDDDV